MSEQLKDVLDKIETLKNKRAELMTELTPIIAKSKSNEKLDSGQGERFSNLYRGVEKIDEELKAAETVYRGYLMDGYLAGHYGAESGDGSRLPARPYKGQLGPVGALAAAVRDAGFSLKSRPSVEVSAYATLKANVFPASTTLNTPQAGPTYALGHDARFLWPMLPTVNAGNDTAVSDFRQTTATVTGSVERAIDAATTKANLDVTIVAVTEALKQYAITINSVPNVVLESVPSMVNLVNGEATFQLNKALDAAVLSQIVAAAPAFGTSGTTTIDKVRNAIASMRAAGANPDVVVMNPADVAALDLFRVGGSTTTDGPYQIDVSSGTGGRSLWGMKVVERVGGGSDPMYLLDTSLLGALYLGSLRFAADPFSEFRANLTTLRVEINALFHIRQIAGARRIAAA